MAHHGLPAHSFQSVDLCDTPAFSLGVGESPFLMVLRTFAPGLVFGRDPDPDPHLFDRKVLHNLTSITQLTSDRRL